MLTNRDQVMQRLVNLREDRARCEYLRMEIPRLQRTIDSLREEIVDNEVHITQTLSDMPHGSGTSDPTGRLGLKLAGGYEPAYIREIELEIAQKRAELEHKEVCVWCIETGLKCLTDKERFLVEHKYVRGDFWRNIIEDFNNSFGEVYVSKEPLKRTIERALETIERVLN